MAAVAVLRNETLQAFLQVCAQVSLHFSPLLRTCEVANFSLCLKYVSSHFRC